MSNETAEVKGKAKSQKSESKKTETPDLILSGARVQKVSAKLVRERITMGLGPDLELDDQKAGVLSKFEFKLTPKGGVGFHFWTASGNRGFTMIGKAIKSGVVTEVNGEFTYLGKPVIVTKGIPELTAVPA